MIGKIIDVTGKKKIEIGEKVMKKIIISALSLMLLASCSSTISNEQATSSPTATAVAAEAVELKTVSICGMQFKIPKSWQHGTPSEEDEYTFDYYYSDTGMLMFRYGPMTNFSLSDQAYIDSFISGFASGFTGTVETSDEVVTLNNDIPSLKVDFTGTLEGLDLIGRMYHFQFNNYDIGIMYADYNDYKFYHENEFDDIMNSLKVVHTYRETELNSSISSETNTENNAVISTSTPEPIPTQAPTVTISQLNAYRAAQNYLSFMAFSRTGLINQLVFEGYSEEDATYGVDRCNADWMAQAVKKAKNYLETSAFSYSGLIGQLEFEGFSNEEATHGANNCGADWNEQAAKKARNYMDLMPYSREDLLSQLMFEGFTAEQAEYGVSSVGL